MPSSADVTGGVFCALHSSGPATMCACYCVTMEIDGGVWCNPLLQCALADDSTVADGVVGKPHSQDATVFLYVDSQDGSHVSHSAGFRHICPAQSRIASLAVFDAIAAPLPLCLCRSARYTKGKVCDSVDMKSVHEAEILVEAKMMTRIWTVRVKSRTRPNNILSEVFPKDAKCSQG